MITKERLVSGLNEMIFVEEGMVSQHVGFSKALISYLGMDNDKKIEIEKLLFVLQRDSARHKDTIEKIVKLIKLDRRDEF